MFFPYANSNVHKSIIVMNSFDTRFSRNVIEAVKKQMQILSANIGVQIKPVFQTKKIGQILALKEKKPPIVNNQCVVYKFECDLCDTDYFGYTACHLHQRINEHKYSVIGRHLEQHGLLKTVIEAVQKTRSTGLKPLGCASWF